MCWSIEDYVTLICLTSISRLNSLLLMLPIVFLLSLNFFGHDEPCYKGYRGNRNRRNAIFSLLIVPIFVAHATSKLEEPGLQLHIACLACFSSFCVAVFSAFPLYNSKTSRTSGVAVFIGGGIVASCLLCHFGVTSLLRIHLFPIHCVVSAFVWDLFFGLWKIAFTRAEATIGFSFSSIAITLSLENFLFDDSGIEPRLQFIALANTIIFAAFICLWCRRRAHLVLPKIVFCVIALIFVCKIARNKELHMYNLQWITRYVLHDPDHRNRLKRWFLTLCAGLPLIFAASLRERSVADKRGFRLVVRKLFHLLSLFIFLPNSRSAREIEFLAFCVYGAFLAFIVVEVVRANKIIGISSRINYCLSRFIDERDGKGIILTHMYLLTGCSFTIISEAISGHPVQTLHMIGGSMVIAVGDAMAAVVGVNCGANKWNKHTKKSIQGSVAFVISAVLAGVAYAWYIQEGSMVLSPSLSSYIIAVCVASIVEIFTEDVDNLVLPLLFSIVYKSGLMLLEMI